jgi:hypothetical protein
MGGHSIFKIHSVGTLLGNRTRTMTTMKRLFLIATALPR